MYRHRSCGASTCVAPPCRRPSCAPPCRAAASTSTRCCPRCGPSSRRSPSAAPTAALEYGESFDGVRPDRRSGCPPTKLEAALDELDADVRAALEVAIDRARAVHADQRRTDTTTTLAPGATVTERWVPVERVGLYVPGGNAVYPSSVVMNVVPAQTAGVDSLVIASPPQAEFGGLPHPTILAAAALLGVDEVWAVGGAQAVALLAYGGTDTDGAELAPGRHDHRAGQHLRHRGQADLPFAGRHRRRGRPDRDRDPRRPHRRPGARRRRSDQPGRARRDGRQRAGHRQRRAGRRHRPGTRAPAGDHRAPRAGDRGADRASSRRSCSSTTSTPGCGWSTPTPPSTWRSRPSTPPTWPAGSVRPARFSSAPGRRSASATTAPGPTTCCPPRAARGTPAACRCRRSCAASTSSTTPRRR